MTATRRQQIAHWHAGRAETRIDELAREEPLEIRVNGHPVSVTMRTPGEDEELAAGFLLTEGMIESGSDLREIKPALIKEDCNVIEVTLSEGVGLDLERLTRHVFASSSCGLCGKATIEAVQQQFPRIESDLTVAASVLQSLPPRLRAAQRSFERTGGLHAAAIFDLQGNLLAVREDVGRHNAVDKLLGAALLEDQLPFDRHILMVSGRSSFEIMQKALAGRLPIVAAVSAPSSLAVDFAAQSGQTLIGFLRGETMNVYAGQDRVRA